MFRINVPLAILAAGLLAAAPSPAPAQAIQSNYTSIAEKACKKIDAAKNGEGDWSVWSCPGRAGYIVLVTEDDLRTKVSVGRTVAEAEKEPAAEQGFGPFNKAQPNVEWRSAGGKPFAIIQRWTIADNEDLEKSGRPKSVPILVVTRLPPGPVCHIAYIDGKAPDANALARKAADETARAFHCGDEVAIVGPPGRGTALTKPGKP